MISQPVRRVHRWHRVGTEGRRSSWLRRWTVYRLKGLGCHSWRLRRAACRGTLCLQGSFRCHRRGSHNRVGQGLQLLVVNQWDRRWGAYSPRTRCGRRRSRTLRVQARDICKMETLKTLETPSGRSRQLPRTGQTPGKVKKPRRRPRRTIMR
jgi:hypothetical protein